MENKGRKIGWKTIFFTVWQNKENVRMQNPGENFLSQAHNLHPPKSGGKLWREKCSHRGITQMPSPTYPLHKHNSCSGIN